MNSKGSVISGPAPAAHLRSKPITNFTLAVQKLDLDLLSGETLCIVGESGSGKSLTARSVMGLLPALHVCVDRGSIDFLGEEITSITDERLRDIRGNEF